MKRTFDLLTSLIGILLLAPILLMVAAAVKLSSQGPVIFLQRRVGRNGNLFSIYKFRTMSSTQSHPQPSVTGRSDPRITTVGKFLRKTKLDELPQLFNVLMGDMSIVGPRPEVEQFTKFIPQAQLQIIQSVRPGITDYASIIFRNEEALLSNSKDVEKTYVEEILPLKTDLQCQYVSNANLWFDLKLILQTLKTIIFE